MLTCSVKGFLIKFQASNEHKQTQSVVTPCPNTPNTRARSELCMSMLVSTEESNTQLEQQSHVVNSETTEWPQWPLLIVWMQDSRLPFACTCHERGLVPVQVPWWHQSIACWQEPAGPTRACWHELCSQCLNSSGQRVSLVLGCLLVVQLGCYDSKGLPLSPLLRHWKDCCYRFGSVAIVLAMHVL